MKERREREMPVGIKLWPDDKTCPRIRRTRFSHRSLTSATNYLINILFQASHYRSVNKFMWTF